ncbi:MAG: GNAT family N-acetyltransferase [Bacillota bacterium]
MIEITRVDAPEQKAEICNAILRSLPDWFGIESSIQEYTRNVKAMPFWAATDAGTPVGFAALKLHNVFTAELYVTGIAQAYHRQGVGRRLVAQCADFCRALELRFLTVKTLDESAGSECYDRTRMFYQAAGFIPLEVFPALWDPRNPCLLMVMPLWANA